MEKYFTLPNIYTLYNEYQLLVMFTIMIILLYPFLSIIKIVLIPSVKKMVGYENQKYSALLEKKNIYGSVTNICLGLYLVFWDNIFDKSSLSSPLIIKLKDVLVTTYVIFTITSLLLAIINVATELYNSHKLNGRIAIDLHAQILRIFIVIASLLAVFSLVIGIPISSLFASLGAIAALLTFIFKDSLLGLIASLQVTFQNIIQVGDWVTLPQYNADGNIQKITITVVVVRNFDNTYTTVPTSVFLTTGVKNWRSMFESGGRRIKRAINLDMNYIKILSEAELNELRKLPLMAELEEENKELFIAQTTNITMFRHYIKQYLGSHSQIHKKSFSFIVRTLDPTPNGLPIELYAFTKDTKWDRYEEIQSDIFEHLLAIMPSFKLRAFQLVSQT